MRAFDVDHVAQSHAIRFVNTQIAFPNENPIAVEKPYDLEGLENIFQALDRGMA